jgi:hypothetical protein
MNAEMLRRRRRRYNSKLVHWSHRCGEDMNTKEVDPLGRPEHISCARHARKARVQMYEVWRCVTDPLVFLYTFVSATLVMAHRLLLTPPIVRLRF